jgi:hypothetical protein
MDVNTQLLNKLAVEKMAIDPPSVINAMTTYLQERLSALAALRMQGAYGAELKEVKLLKVANEITVSFTLKQKHETTISKTWTEQELVGSTWPITKHLEDLLHDAIAQAVENS